MDDELITILVIVFTAIMIVALIVSAVLFLVNSLEKESCKRIAEKMDVEYTYSLMTGCFIKYNREWIPINNFGIIKLKS